MLNYPHTLSTTIQHLNKMNRTSMISSNTLNLKQPHLRTLNQLGQIHLNTIRAVVVLLHCTDPYDILSSKDKRFIYTNVTPLVSELATQNFLFHFDQLITICSKTDAEPILSFNNSSPNFTICTIVNCEICGTASPQLSVWGTRHFEEL